MNRIRLSLILIVVAACVASLPTNAAAEPGVHGVASGVGAKFDTYVAQYAKANLFSGSVLLVRNGVILLNKGYGYANQAAGVRNTPHTRFFLASITKAFTAAAVMKLQDAGQLNVTARACAYLSGCPRGWKSITVHQLLSHRSGIKDLSELPAYIEGTNYTPKQIIAMAQKVPLSFRPGTNFSYSNTGYVVLAQIVERVSGKPYAQFLGDQILRPLGLGNTGVARAGAATPKIAQRYTEHTPVTMAMSNLLNFFGAANMYSTTGDVYRWDQALLGGKVVSHRSLQAMTTRWTAHPSEGAPSFGYGLIPDLYKGHAAIIMTGGTAGIANYNFVFPKDHVIFILLSNGEQSTAGMVVDRALSLTFG